jgi:HSP20 family protein
MNALSRWDPFKSWDPFKEMQELQDRLSSAFGLAPVRPTEGGKETMTVARWYPLVDITEDDKEYVIKAELPEIRREDVRVTVENGVLTLSGERKYEQEEKGRKYHRVERAYGNFVRSFTLPDDADPGKVAAEFKDGVLRIRVTKQEQARPKTIEVKVA